ncbi:GNAT family N-acetyltransferase [Neobacillus sp. D3-1R]|uniref:GNAT family N-acetyltransferase n=1 Tax=Neobacillus sp. D3-1R TaxID=3445778 RepID=UPI003FA13FD8
METMIRMACEQDLPTLVQFLEKANLGTEGLKETIEYFLLLEDESGRLRGTIGVEPFGENGLLRSLVVTAGMTEKDILLLFQQILRLTKEKEMTSLFLATNKRESVSFFEMLGFTIVPESSLPEDLYRSEHIKNILNVDNSIFLKIEM